jgi:(p)ppGpp synthase/HD superfamily hydrolase
MALLGERFERALVLAAQLHRDQVRKGTGVPYVSHLLAVAALVLEHGGDEDEAIAALLHDAPEDQGGHPTLARIHAEFGPRVAALVEGATDTFETPKPPWRARKERYLAHLADSAGADAGALRLALADKLHNARITLADLHKLGPEVWERFSGKRDGTLWYLKSVAAIGRSHGAHFDLLDQLEEVNEHLADAPVALPAGPAPGS